MLKKQVKTAKKAKQTIVWVDKKPKLDRKVMFSTFTIWQTESQLKIEPNSRIRGNFDMLDLSEISIC